MTDDAAIGHLLALAEVAGVFVAFGVLIGAIQTNGQRGSRKEFAAAATCAIGMVTLLACILPLLLQAFGVVHIWFHSSLGFILLIGLGFLAANLNPRFRKNNPTFRREPIIATIFWVVLEIPLQVSLIINIFGLLPEHAIALYLTAVIFNFAESGLFLLLMVFGDEQPE